jgi:succinate dehydrogenase / fumarate reductase cytochrome b subunit
MIHTGIIILIFLVIHLVDFYFVLKIWGEVETVLYDGKEYHDLGSLVLAKFKLPGFVIGYILSFIFLGFHLIHGFHSAFQSIGFNRKKFLSGAKIFGYVYTFVIVGGYTAIPLIIYFMD